MQLYESIGTLNYSFNENYGYKLIVEVDQQLVDYYKKLIPKWIHTQPQMYKAHISVVRKEIPPNLQFWNKYQSEVINFNYSSVIYNDDRYFWLNVFCNRLERIREELGLPLSSKYTRPPAGFIKCFHITLCNTKRSQ